MHCSELHALFKADTNSELDNSTSDVRRQNVMMVDWLLIGFSHKG